MFCPRCGHRSDEGSRHCSNCGERLPDLVEAEKPALGERLRAFGRRLIGGSRRERLVTIGIAAALVVAAVSALALPANEDDESPADTRDPYIQEADAICLDAKHELEVALDRAGTVKQTGLNSIEAFAREFGPITERMRSRLTALDPPPQYQVKAAELDAALRRIEVAGRRTAHFAAQQDARALVAFGRVQVIGGRMESIFSELGLTRCETIQVTASR